MSISIKQLSIRGRILTLTLTMLLLLTVVSIYSLVSIRMIGTELTTIANEDIPLTEAIAAIAKHQLELAVHVERAMRYGKC